VALTRTRDFKPPIGYQEVAGLPIDRCSSDLVVRYASGSSGVNNESAVQTQLDHLQAIFGIIAVIFVVKSYVSIAEL
jgi:hypothetical protein